MRKTILFLSLIVAMMMGTTHAQAYNFEISGTVSGAITGQPMANHTVNVLDSLSGVFLSGVTNANGFYSITMQVNGFTQPMYLVSTMGLCGPGDYYADVVFASPAGSATVNFTVCDSIVNSPSCNAEFSYSIDYGILMSPNQALVSFFDYSSANDTIIDWMWIFSDGQVSTQQSPDIAFTYASGLMTTINACLTITTNSGCSSTYCSDFILGDTLVNPNGCAAMFMANPVSNPAMGIAVYDFLNMSWGTSNIVAYFWEFGDGSTSTDMNPSHTYSNALIDTFNVCLTIVTADSCTSTYCDYVIAGGNTNPYCQADFYYFQDSSVSFSQYAYQFIDNSIGNVASYYWDFGNGITYNTPTVIHGFPGYGTYNVCLTIQTYDSCSHTTCYAVLVDSIQSGTCQAMFTYNNPTGTAGMFTDISITNTAVVSWEWNFGDGTVSFDQNPIHTYTAFGWYNVCLTILTTDSCSSTFCQDIYFVGGGSGNCQADYTWTNPISPNGNTQVVFTDNSMVPSGSTIISWLWDFGDGNTSTLQNPTHIYASAGMYFPCLAILTSDSCMSDFCNYVIVGDTLPNPDCQAMFYYGGSGTLLNQFTDASWANGTIIAWSWDFGDGTTSTDQNPIHTFATSGSYNVCLEITSDNGCVSSYCDMVYVNTTGGCNADFFYYTNNPTGMGLDFVFQDISQGNIISWMWDFGDSTISTLQNPTHTYAVAGLYDVCLTIETSDSCVSTSCLSVMAMDTIVSNCMAYFAYGGTGGAMLPGVFIDGSSASGNILDWNWDFGDGTMSSDQNPIHHYASAGYYNVCLTIFTDNNCTDTYCQTIFYDSTGVAMCQAAFTYAPAPTLLCPFNYQFVDVSYTTGNVISWMWDFGDGNTSTLQDPVNCYAAGGQYQATLTIMTDDSCTSSYTHIISVSGGATNYSLSGQVYANNMVVTNGVVLLMGVTGSIYTGTLTPNGAYYVTGLPQDTYIALAIPSFANYPNYVPTYHDSSLFWNVATEIVLVSDTAGIDIQLQDFSNTATGPGTIAGSILWAGTKTTNTYKDRLTASVEDVSVMLFDMSDNLLGYAQSDATGGFQFSNLAYGTYKLYVELTGHTTYPAIVTIDANNMIIDDIVFDIDAGTVYYSIDDLSISGDVKLYPNPVQNNLFVEFVLNSATDLKVSAFNTLGQEVLSEMHQLPSGAQNLTLDVSRLDNGIYFINLQAEGQESKVFRFVK